MYQYVLRRIFTFVITIFAVTLITFTVFHILPGDPALLILGTEADVEALDTLREELGLRGPLLVQYFRWLAGLAKGDLGMSVRLSQPVSNLIRERLPLTMGLTALAIVLTAAVSLPLGLSAAVNRGRRTDVLIQSVTQVGLAVPFFWAGIMLILLFSLKLRWFPPGGYVSWSENPLQSLKSVFLPALALALPRVAILTRLVRTAVLDVLDADYIRTARSKGLPEREVLWRHVLRNASIPIVTVLGVHTAGLLSGAIVAEEIFALPGVGRLLLAGIGYRDIPLVQGLSLAIAVMVLSVNFVVDVLYLWLEPRVHYS